MKWEIRVLPARFTGVREALDTMNERDATGTRPLPPAAQRALAEAKARHEAAKAETAEKELAGRGGLEPVRYGDWEVKGIASDF
jgi:hypothetical protein